MFMRRLSYVADQRGNGCANVSTVVALSTPWCRDKMTAFGIFQFIHFLVSNMLYNNSNVTEMCCQWSSYRYASIHSGNALSTFRWQYVIWTNDCHFSEEYMRYAVSMCQPFWILNSLKCVHIFIVYTSSPLIWIRAIKCAREDVACLLSLQWRQNERDSVSNHQSHDCLPNRLFRRRSKKTSKLRVTGLCVGNSPATGEFPAQMASNAENVSIWWRHHGPYWNVFGRTSAEIALNVFV